MRTLEQRDACAIPLGDDFFFLLTHLVRIVELLEKLVWVLNAIDAKIQIVDVLIAGPKPRGLIRRIGTVRRQRKVRLGADDSRHHGFGRERGTGRDGSRTNDVEAEDRSDERQIDDAGHDVATNTGTGFRHVRYPPKVRKTLTTKSRRTQRRFQNKKRSNFTRRLRVLCVFVVNVHLFTAKSSIDKSPKNSYYSQPDASADRDDDRAR